MKSIVYILVLAYLLSSCAGKPSPNQEMVNLLSNIAGEAYTSKNAFCPQAKLTFFDSILKSTTNRGELTAANYFFATAALQLGDEQKSVAAYEQVLKSMAPQAVEQRIIVMRDLAMAYLRLGERLNCIYDHSAESCVFPITGKGVHYDKTGSEKAISMYETILQYDSSDLESRWLLNIAYMTVGKYPAGVPTRFLIKGLDTDTVTGIKPFVDAAVNIGLHTKNMAGGSIVDDFNNDGYFDIVTSSWSLDENMHYCRNNWNGTFTDISDSSGLGLLTGGLNIMQTDYNNDGLKDIFVLRGAWKGQYGKEPNSLLRNNGNGTFSDVTRESGLLSFHPTQTATWADFNSDGWLDVFIGNESTTGQEYHPCELYINNKNGTFTEIASQAGVAIVDFVKGVTSGDYDKDDRPDIFISTLTGRKVLLKNEGVQNGTLHFKDVTQESGLAANQTRTFPTWFWDYDNDGWLDILVCSYEFDKALSWYAAAEALNIPVGNSGKVFLFRNKHNGTFEDVSEKAGLTKVAFAMGSNFGDIDNDGYPDIYLGTGNPQYKSLVPNKFFKNVNGERFIDITTAARVGNLQKGHGVSFADLDSDGDQDIYIDMGGAYTGDIYQNSLYINPGQNSNRWVDITLEGATCNRLAIGATIKVTFKENGIQRSVYRTVNSGGSFGSNPLTQHIGIGSATAIERVELKWPGNAEVQVVENIKPGMNVKIKEGKNTFSTIALKKVDFIAQRSGLISCSP